MTYSAMTAKETGDLITETEWDKIKENFDHLAAMLFGASALSALTAGAQLSASIGTYTGDGAATKAITGVGFQPRYMVLYRQTGGTVAAFIVKSNQDGSNNSLVVIAAGGGGLEHSAAYNADAIRSLDADGFTVGDCTGLTSNYTNISAAVYAYIAWR